MKCPQRCHEHFIATSVDRALVLGVCASDDPALASSLMQLHDVDDAAPAAEAGEYRAGVRALRRRGA